MKRYLLISLVCHLSVLGIFLAAVFLAEPQVIPERVISVSLVSGEPAPPQRREPEPRPRPEPTPEPPPEPEPTPEPEPEPTPEPEPEPPRPSLAERLRERLPSGDPERTRRENAREISRLPERRETENSAPEKPPPAPEPEARPPEELTTEKEADVSLEVTPGFTDDLYLSLLARRLSERWILARSEAGLSLVSREVRVRFQIDRRGGIENITVLSPSGSLAFDRSAQEVVRDAGPLRPLPSEWHLDTLRVTVRFSEL